MSWNSSDRASRLPSGWQAIRLRVLRRDGYRCRFPGCGKEATDVDHIRAGDDHDDSNLQSLCKDHHATKSGREGKAASARRLAELRAMTKRRPEASPGFISPRERRNRPEPTKGW